MLIPFSRIVLLVALSPAPTPPAPRPIQPATASVEIAPVPLDAPKWRWLTDCSPQSTKMVC